MMGNEQYGTLWDMIDKRMEYMEEGINTIKTDVAVIKERQVTVISDLSNVKTTIYGNGKPGILTQLALIYQKVAIIAFLGGSGVSFIVTIGLWYLKNK